MKISTYDTWLKLESEYRRRMAKHYPKYADPEWEPESEQRRMGLHVNFPFSAVLEGYYPEHDYALRWCWQNFGPAHGRCCEWHSEYPGCPLVLATAAMETGNIKDQARSEQAWERLRYSDPG